MAGESARAKAARLRRSAEMWERGAAGEQATAEALRALPDGWVVLHDVSWPGRQHANIDHVVVGPPGAFVVDSKNWTGSVTVRGGELRQNGRDRRTSVWGVAAAAQSVAGLVLSVPRLEVHPVLCLVSTPGLRGRVESALVCSLDHLVTMLTSRPQVLSRQDVAAAADDLERRLHVAVSRRRRVRARPAAEPASIFAAPEPRAPRRSSRKRHKARRGGPTLGRLLGALATLAALLVASANLDAITDVVSGVIAEPNEPAEDPAVEKPAPEEPASGQQPGQPAGKGPAK